MAQVVPAKIMMNETADSDNANLVAGGSTYLHGVSLADFAVTCGNLPGFTLWAPVQDECSIGTLANNIDQTLFLDEVYVNNLEFSYTTGANATENYSAETDNKMWLLNAGRFVNFESTISGSMLGTDSTNAITAGMISDGYVDLALDATAEIAELSTGIGFLRKDKNGAAAVTHFDDSANTMMNVEIMAGIAADVGLDELSSSDGRNYVGKYIYELPATSPDGNHTIHFPTGAMAPVEGDRLQVVYAANAYNTPMNTYFKPLEEPTDRPDSVGALRQGQVEVYIVDPDSGATGFDNAWRLTGATITSDLTREPLMELGHLGPYDRPLTLPIPITLTVDSTAGDLENWAKFAGKLSEYLSGDDTSGNTSFDDIDLNDLMNKENLSLVIKVFEQTDEEAGGTYTNRKVMAGSALDGEEYFADGVLDTYSPSAGNPVREYALKTIVVKNLKITDEGMTLDLGSNATQTFGFRSNNDLFAIKGDISYGVATSEILRNA